MTKNRGADKIGVIDKGRLAEEGTHDALVNAGGRSSPMWEQYTGALALGIRPTVNKLRE